MVPQTKPEELAPREQRPPYGTGLDLSEEATEDVNEAVEWPVDADYEEWERYEEDALPHEAPLLFTQHLRCCFVSPAAAYFFFFFFLVS